MIQALYTGIIGIQSHQTAIDVTSDNLSNINTVGFRSYNTEFAPLFDNARNTDSAESSVNSTIGIGSRIQATGLNLTQGTLIHGDKDTDLAIVGDGWFGVIGNSEQNNQRLYTRSGNFSFDRDRALVTQNGMYVTGTIGNNIDFDTNTLTQERVTTQLNNVSMQQRIQLPQTLTYPAQATTHIDFSGNLGTDNQQRVISSSAIDANGNVNKVKLTFTKSQNQPSSGVKWDITAVVTSRNEETTYSTATGSVTFNSNGGLVSTTLSSVDNNGTPVSINLGTNFSGVTSISNLPISASSSSNGVPRGDLVGYQVGQDGEILASFTNGRQSSVGKIAVYHFMNDQGLERVSGTLFKESSNSGRAMFYTDGNGNNILGSRVLNHKLESSNANITNGLTELIVFQRAYDANAKSITTADQMIQKALNMDA
jgi:flagellar hook protein FlgE